MFRIYFVLTEVSLFEQCLWEHIRKTFSQSSESGSITDGHNFDKSEKGYTLYYTWWLLMSKTAFTAFELYYWALIGNFIILHHIEPNYTLHAKRNNTKLRLNAVGARGDIKNF